MLRSMLARACVMLGFIALTAGFWSPGAFAASAGNGPYYTYITALWVGNGGMPVTFHYTTNYSVNFQYYFTSDGQTFDQVTYYDVGGALCGEPYTNGDSFAVGGNGNTFSDSGGDSYNVSQSALTSDYYISCTPSYPGAPTAWGGGHAYFSSGQIVLLSNSMAVQAHEAWAIEGPWGPDWTNWSPAAGDSSSPKWNW